MRLFGGERIGMIMDRLNIDESQPIEHSILSHSIENAQKNVEGRNFGIRKNVLQYDDVLNRQREIIYKQRDQVLDGIDMKEQILRMLDQSIEDNVARYLPKTASSAEEWDFAGLRLHYIPWLISDDELDYSMDRLAATDQEEIY